MSTNRDFVVNFTPSEDVILALDHEGNELCRLGFQVNGRQVTFKTPAIARYSKFRVKLAQLFMCLAEHAPNLNITDDPVKAYSDPTSNAIWERLSAIAVSTRPIVQNLIMELFFDYLEGSIEGVESKRIRMWYDWKWNPEKNHRDAQKEWFLRNARIDDIQRIFAACLAVDDLIKKNASFVLEKELGLDTRNLRALNSEPISVPKPGFGQSGTIPIQSSLLEQL